MKKAVKRVLIGIAAVILLFAGAGLWYRFPRLAMDPAKTGQVPGTNIYAVKNVINSVYFIKTENGYIMVDTGSDLKRLEAAIKPTGIDTGDVKWILLTHSDYDHTTGLPLFPNAAIYMSEDELPLLNGTKKRAFMFGNTLPPGIDINKINLLTDGQELSCYDTKVKCIKAPGHTIGSMAYLVDGRYLFSGDAFKFKSGKISVHPYTMDTKTAQKTIDQLTETIKNSSIVFTAHYGYH